MQHHNTVAQKPKKLAQPGVRIDREFWRTIQKLIIDLDIPTRQFMEEALKDRAKLARQELRERRGSQQQLPTTQQESSL